MTKLEIFKEATVSTVKDAEPKCQKREKNKWMTNKILDRMRFSQQTSNRRSEEYNQVDRELKKNAEKRKRSGLMNNVQKLKGPKM